MLKYMRASTDVEQPGGEFRGVRRGVKCPVIGQGMHAQGLHSAILVGCDLRFNVIVAAETCAAQVLGTVFNPLDGLSGGNRGDHCAYIAGVDGYFVAKATAEIR